MFAAHVCGMLIALLAHHSSTQSSECAWYFVAYTFDTTLGLGLTVAFHKTVIRFAKCWKKRHAARLTVSSDRWFDIVAQCGDYGEPPSLLRWWIQMVEWVLCVVGARAVCGTLVRRGSASWAAQLFGSCGAAYSPCMRTPHSAVSVRRVPARNIHSVLPAWKL